MSERYAGRKNGKEKKKTKVGWQKGSFRKEKKTYWVRRDDERVKT